MYYLFKRHREYIFENGLGETVNMSNWYLTIFAGDFSIDDSVVLLVDVLK